MPDTDKLRERAYALWEQEGRPDGRHEDHWYRAHQELSGTGTDDLPELDSGTIDPDGKPATAPAIEGTGGTTNGTPQTGSGARQRR